VTRNGDGTWYCDSCNQRTINWESRCLLLFQIKDHTGSTSFTAGASTDNIYILRALCTDHGLYSDKQLQQFPWDPGDSILLHRLGGKPKLKKGGMLGISYGWAFTWAMGLCQSSHAWMGDYKCKGQERDNRSNNYQTNQYRLFPPLKFLLFFYCSSSSTRIPASTADSLILYLSLPIQIPGC
jgi:hypothetical protein